jgi:dihydrofolate synthase/folylpolyglutamate synthase
MRVLIEALGHPERRFPSVIVAGTNGKGSTSATLASILRCAGYRTGLYTSPHLIRVNERISINGEPISDPEFAEIHSRIDTASRELIEAGKLDQQPSFFETLTAMAFEYFASSGIEIAVLEVGIGGRLDATNVADPLLSVVTDISLDHTEWLGNTLTEIAREKAGIIRRGGTVVTLPQFPEVNDTLGECVRELEARVVNATAYVPAITPVSPQFAAESAGAPHNRYSLEVLGEQIEIDSALSGRHQLRNTAIAIAAAVELKRSFGYEITPQDIAEGVRHTRWLGRFQVIANSPEVVLDVAHNPAGAWALRSTLSSRHAANGFTIIFGAMRDKAIGEIAEILFPIAEEIVLTHVKSPRAASLEEIQRLVAHVGVPITIAADLEDAIQIARQRGRTIVITGSVYLVGAALEQLQTSS